jgi:opacity protein-like surface antigen
MIIKALCVACLVLTVSLSASAQETPKVEVFGGYSWAGGDFHGWNGSVTGNVNKWFGVVADFSGHYGSEQEGTIRVNQNAHSFLFGPRISYRGKKLVPFGYAVFGATRFEESAVVFGQRLSATDTGFSSAYGGGLDLKVTDHVTIRTFQLDYFRPNFFGEAHHRGRLAFGVVFNIGRK